MLMQQAVSKHAPARFAFYGFFWYNIGVATGEEIAVPVWMSAVVLVFACAVIAYSIMSVKRASRNDALVEISTEARVVRVRGRNSNMLNRWFAGGSVSYFHNVNREYYVTFESLPDSTLRQFAIPVVVHSEIDEGETGILTFQGTRFISFEQRVRNVTGTVN